MYFWQEYIERHSIIAEPVVHYPCSGTLLLKTYDSNYWNSKWLIFSLKCADGGGYPGVYYISYYTPIRDGFKRKELFKNVGSRSEREWDDYESFIIKWSKNIKGALAVKNNRELIFVAWEIFVYIFDSWIIKDKKFEKLSYAVLDLSRSHEERYQSYLDALVYLSNFHLEVLRIWKYEILFNFRDYMDWLVDLVNDL